MFQVIDSLFYKSNLKNLLEIERLKKSEIIDILNLHRFILFFIRHQTHFQSIKALNKISVWKIVF